MRISFLSAFAGLAVVSATVLGGCSEERVPAAATEAHEDGHGHAHTAPHGGTLVELGDHVANLEVVLNAETGALDLYVLDGHATNYVRLAIPAVAVRLTWEGAAEPVAVELPATASTLTGETVGDTARFSAVFPQLVGKTAVTLTIPTIMIGGTTYTDITAQVRAQP